MFSALFFAVIGYLSGSIRFARIFGYLIKHRDVTLDGNDQNPGTFNAFVHGGFICGAGTLLGDMAKGFLPVFAYMHLCEPSGTVALALVVAAPVIGHIYPIYYRFKGGKGIATSFGSLLGLVPFMILPVISLAVVFLFFLLVVRITPLLYATEVVYVAATIVMLILPIAAGVWLGFLLITVAVMSRLLSSQEERDKLKISLLWFNR